MSRAKATGPGRRRAPGGQGAGPPHREPPGIPQPGPAAGPHLPAGGGHPGRHPGPQLVRRLGGGRGHRVRDRGHLRARRGGAEELGRAPPGAGRPVQRPAGVGRRPLLAGADGVGRPDRPGQPAHRREGPVPRIRGDRVGAAGHGRRGRRGGRDRDRGAGLHPLDHRVRRHRGPRGDGAPTRHGDHRGRRDGGGGAGAGPGGRLQPDAGRRAPGRRRGRDRLHQGHDPHRAVRPRRPTRSGPTSGRPTSCPRPNGSPT